MSAAHEKDGARIIIAGDERAIGNVDLSNISLIGDRDELELAATGKKQVLKRNFGFWSVMGLALSSTITWEGMTIVFLYGLLNGGPAGLIYGYLFTWVGYGSAMASLAELCSMVPSAGGQYHWVYLLAPPRFKNIFSYITGWQTVIAWQAAVASTGYLGGTIIQGLIVMNYENYQFERWHGTLLLFGVMFVATAFNTLLAKHLPKVECAVLVIHLLGFIALIVPLVVLAPVKGTASDVFATFLKLGGYESSGLTFFVGLVGATFAFVGADGAVHMAEETENATTVVPWCMVGAIGINGTLGFGFLIALLFCIGNIDKAVGALNTTGYPFLEIFHQAVGSNAGATAMASFIVAIVFFASMSLFAAASRLTWSFAREKAMPGSRWLGKVEPRTQLPLWSCALTLTISLLLSLINIGSSAAFNAVVSLVVAGFLGSYLLPIGLLIYTRLTKPHSLRWGPWTLGRAGLPINIFTLLWAIIAMVFSFFPVDPNPTPVTMNWSCLLYGGTFLFALLFYFVHGRKVYNGPIIETTLAERLS